MKICYLGDAGSPHLRRWTDHYRKHGSQVAVISARLAQEEDAGVLHMPFSSWGKAAYLASMPWVGRQVKEYGPDIVHAHYVTSYGGIAGRIGFRPFILSAWGSDVLSTLQGHGIGSMFLRWFDRPALENCSAITVESDALVPAVLRLGVPVEKIVVIPWGVDTNLFRVASMEERQEARLRLGIPQDALVILGIRSVKQTYNTITQVRALRSLLRHNRNVYLIVLAGVRDDGYLCRVMHEISSCRLEHHVRIIEELLCSKELAGIIQASNCVISVPSWDSTSVSVLEAASTGVPLVLSDIPANRSLIQKGLLAELSAIDEDMISDSILRAVAGRWLTECVNPNVVNTGFSWQGSTHRMTKLYETVLRGTGK